MRISRVIAGPELNSCDVKRLQLLEHLFERKLRQQRGETSNSHERKRTTARRSASSGRLTKENRLRYQPGRGNEEAESSFMLFIFAIESRRKSTRAAGVTKQRKKPRYSRCVLLIIWKDLSQVLLLQLDGGQINQK